MEQLILPILLTSYASMKIRVEQFLIAGGVLASLWMISYVLLYKSTSIELHELFRGGTIGGIVIGLLYIAGFFGIVVFSINVVTGARSNWLLRLVMCLFFLVTAGISGSF